jgi:glycerol-3-phosphate dehydrogenase (NAD(P)+)
MSSSNTRAVFQHISLLGDGGWGTALACLLARNNRDVSLWGHLPDVTEEMRSTGENRRFLPGFSIPASVNPTNDMKIAVHRAELIVFSTPVMYLRSVAEEYALYLEEDSSAHLMTVSKGIERRTLLRASEVIGQVLGAKDVGLLVGPSHAEEVARGLPASVTSAARDPQLAIDIQNTFMNDRFRVYTSDDSIGVEVSAAVKNVIAITVGICEGLSLGDNARAALLTRGLAEITRLGQVLGARRETFAGFSGLGDLITTCISPYGRNRRVGIEIGRGRKVRQVLDEMAPMVPEGVYTTESVCALAERFRVDMPIAQAVYDVLFHNKQPLQAAEELMSREPKPEFCY